MTSKNYLCKSIKENIRRNLFLTILISLALLVVFPVYCITGIEGSGGIDIYIWDLTVVRECCFAVSAPTARPV